MPAPWLHWLAPLLEEAQVPLDPEAAPWIEASLRRIANVAPETEGDAVFRVLQDRWLQHGPPGRQLLCTLIRGEVYSRPDSPLRPAQGQGYLRAGPP